MAGMISNRDPAQESNKKSLGKWLDQDLARIVTNGQRDGQADDEPVLDEFKGLINRRSVSLGRRGERQHDSMHEQVNQGSVNQTAKDGTTDQKRQFAAGQVIDRGRAERDDELQEHSEQSGGKAALIRLGTENSAGNGLRNENGMARTVHGNRVKKIHGADNQTTDENRGKRSPGRGRRCYSTDTR